MFKSADFKEVSQKADEQFIPASLERPRPRAKHVRHNVWKELQHEEDFLTFLGQIRDQTDDVHQILWVSASFSCFPPNEIQTLDI